MLNRGAGGWYTKSDNQVNTSEELHMQGLFCGAWVWGIYVANDTLICNLVIVKPSNHPHKIQMP